MRQFFAIRELMRRSAVSLPLIVFLLVGCAVSNASETWLDVSPHKLGFVVANGVRLEYLDWGGSGPALILIHGMGDNPHIFDDLAPEFTGQFHVVAYARRGHGQSEAKSPYDTVTLTEDLRGFMDALGISKADLVGWSMGGNEITGMAGSYPERVGRIIYFDGGYDWGDPDFATAFKNLPQIYIDPPNSVLASLSAWRAYQREVWFPAVSNESRLEAYIRELVKNQPDGTVRHRMSDQVTEEVFHALLSNRRDYTRIHCPALAIYARTLIDVAHAPPGQTKAALGWEQKYMAPFRAKSIERVRRELQNVDILRVPGSHMEFIFTSRTQVARAMRAFLSLEPHHTQAGP